MSKLKCVISMTLVHQVSPFDKLRHSVYTFVGNEPMAQRERYFNTENAYNNGEIKENKIDNTVKRSKSH